MFVVVERGRDVSGNTPVIAVYGTWNSEEEAASYRDELAATNGGDKIFDVEEVTTVEPAAKKK